MKEKPDGKSPSANGGSVQRWVRRLWSATLYRPLMKLAHRWHWHYAPPIFPEGDTVFWCKWCGMRDMMNKRCFPPEEVIEIDENGRVHPSIPKQALRESSNDKLTDGGNKP